MAAGSNRLSPRQKMINLMYIVLTAMLALNVSSDVLDGFTQVHQGLDRSNSNVAARNSAIYSEIRAFAAQNPDKGAQWLDKATMVRRATDSILADIDSLKLLIVRKADGPNGNPDNIESRDDLEAAAVVMLNPANPLGRQLRTDVDKYREFIAGFIPDSTKRANLADILSTQPILRRGNITPQLWEEAKFEQQPVVAAVTLLTKLQNDVLYAEGEALNTLYAQIDAGDTRVNQLAAHVLPQSRTVMRGTPYTAQILLAAVDTTARPTITVAGRQLPAGQNTYTVTPSATGTFTYEGFLTVPHGDGTTTRHPFKSEYTVIEPTATVSATMMNVLYAGIDNPISISVPGVPTSAIQATISGGMLTRSGDRWVARVGGGKEAVITVSAQVDGRTVPMASTPFRVRKLPDPTPFITVATADGGTDSYKGSKPISKALLLKAEGLEAAIDDGLLNTPFKVQSFETVFFDGMGNAMPETAKGDQFTQRQRQAIQRMQRGKRFYITRITATGPDGTTRTLSPMEVIIN